MTTDVNELGGPGAVLTRMREASIAQSADALEALYAADAVHEFPFTRPDLPSRLEGREAIMEFVVAGWGGPLHYERYETLAAYTTGEPGTVVVHQQVHGVSATTGPFVLPNLIVLTTDGEQIRHVRDFVNVLAALDAMGLAT